jgi:hypothetical protein
MHADSHMKMPALKPGCTASVIDIGISRLKSAEFTHLRISAPVDGQTPG